jgi:DNA-binding NarL/FixJ family response regulator
VLIFTMHESETLPAAVRNCGAHGFVTKSQASRDLILAIEALLAGGGFFGNPPSTQHGPQRGPDQLLIFDSADPNARAPECFPALWSTAPSPAPAF